MYLILVGRGHSEWKSVRRRIWSSARLIKFGNMGIWKGVIWPNTMRLVSKLPKRRRKKDIGRAGGKAGKGESDDQELGFCHLTTGWSNTRDAQHQIQYNTNTIQVWPNTRAAKYWETGAPTTSTVFWLRSSEWDQRYHVLTFAWWANLPKLSWKFLDNFSNTHFLARQ